MQPMIELMLKTVGALNPTVTIHLIDDGTRIEWAFAMRDKVYHGNTLVCDITCSLRELVTMYTTHGRSDKDVPNWLRSD